MADLSRRDFLKKTAMTTVGVSAMLAGGGAMAFAEEEKKELKVRAAVCSPTGGTMNAAYLLASMLTGMPEMIDQTSLKSRENEITFAKDELAIFAAPSYAGSIPHAPGLFENLKGNGTPCIIVTAFGNRAAENNFAWMSFTAPAVLGTDLEGNGKPTPIHLCDFGSAGDTWEKSVRYRVWLPKTLHVMHSPYVPYNREN